MGSNWYLLYLLPIGKRVFTILLGLWMFCPGKTRHCGIHTLRLHFILRILGILGWSPYILLFVILLLWEGSSSRPLHISSYWLYWYIISLRLGICWRALSVYLLIGRQFMRVWDIHLYYGRLVSWYSWNFLTF